MITQILPAADGSLIVHGTTTDNGVIKRVVVNRREARAAAPNFAQWEITFEKGAAPVSLSAFAEDAAGNIEPRPHVMPIPRRSYNSTVN